MHIIKSPKYEAVLQGISLLKAELLDPLTSKDHLLNVVCPQIEADYMAVVGALECGAFCLECAMRRIRKALL